jgi:hypothetical protein
MMTTRDREYVLQHEARQCGLLLVKARTHDKRSPYYHRYVLVGDVQAVWRAFHDGQHMTLEEAAAEIAAVAPSWR